MTIHDKAAILWRVGFLVICLGLFPSIIIAADGKSESLINCDVQSGACTRPLDHRTVTLEVLPRPVKAMTDLIFRVTVEGLSENVQPYIDLNMPAMDMGANRVKLIRTEPNTYEGRGVIVRCRSGHRTWCAKVTIPGTGSVDFVFDVIY